MIIDWNVHSIISELEKCYWATTDPRMDGFTTWRCKQDLYQILWYCEDALEKCSTYADEDKFVKRRDQEKMLKTLGKK